MLELCYLLCPSVYSLLSLCDLEFLDEIIKYHFIFKIIFYLLITYTSNDIIFLYKN